MCPFTSDPSNILFYYINTNETPGELSRGKLIFSRVKIINMTVIFTCENITIAMAT